MEKKIIKVGVEIHKEIKKLAVEYEITMGDMIQKLIDIKKLYDDIKNN